MKIRKTKQAVGVVGTVVDTLNVSGANYVPNVDAVNKRDTYSTEEQMIGTWMNKPLYRKVLVKEFSGTSPVFETGFANGYIDTIWLSGDSFIMAKANVNKGINVYESSSQFCRFHINKVGTNIIGSTSGSEYYTGTGYFIMMYTKTTD